jgi:4-amino-4-deoxy-L-arabinose transferase-like glycosyltransferase
MKRFVIGNKYFLLFCAIILVAVFLRFFALDRIPGSLIPDELALGYTTFSILKTGADIHGNFFPISFNVFGTAWTLIGYPLMDFVPQILLGLNEWSVRIPSALAGVFGVILIYFIADILFLRNKQISLLAALVYAISPWNIYFSRLGLEYNLALSVFLFGLLYFLKYIYVNNKKNVLLIIAVISFSLTEFIYYPYVIFIPLFLITLFFIFKSIIIKNKKLPWVLAIFVLSNLLIHFVISQGSIAEESSQNIFKDRGVIYERVEKFRTDKSNEPVLLQRIIHNRYLGVSYQIAQNYVNTFSTSFLFDKGGDKIERDIGYFGKLYLIDALFLLVGFITLFYKRDKATLFLCMWLITAPIASSITKGAPSSSRLFMIMPLFSLVIAYGMSHFLSLLKGNLIKKIFSISVLGLFLLNFIFFIDAYFIHFNSQRVRFLHYGYKQVVELTNRYPYYNVVMKGPDNFPYIYFLFYNQYDPKKFISQVRYYPPTNEGFTFVKAFGRYSFPWAIDYKNLQKKTIYIDSYSANVIYDKKIGKIYLPSGEPILIYDINN